MLRLILSVPFLLAFTLAHAGDGKITAQETQQLATALRNLDGHMIVVKQNGSDGTLMIPWEFGSASLRLRIASDLAIVDHSLKLIDDSRQAIVKELLRKREQRTGEKDVANIKGTDPEYAEFEKQFAELMASPAPGTQDLSRIKASELRLDKNEIPVTVLAALKPILDVDQ